MKKIIISLFTLLFFVIGMDTVNADIRCEYKFEDSKLTIKTPIYIYLNVDESNIVTFSGKEISGGVFEPGKWDPVENKYSKAAGLLTISNKSFNFQSIYENDDYEIDTTLKEIGKKISEDSSCPILFYNIHSQIYNVDMCPIGENEDCVPEDYTILKPSSEIKTFTIKNYWCYRLDGVIDITEDEGAINFYDVSLDSSGNFSDSRGSANEYFFDSDINAKQAPDELYITTDIVKINSNSVVGIFTSINNAMTITGNESIELDYCRVASVEDILNRKYPNADEFVSKLRPESPIDIDFSGEVITEGVRGIIFWVLTAIKYVGIIALIVLGILDFLKAAASGSEDETKKSRQKFVKRLIACIILFLMPYLVNLLLSLVNLTMSNYETKDINNNDTSTKPACASLGIQDCSLRDDCTINGSSSCVDKNNTSTKPACESLGIQACSSRSDCVVNGSSSCKTK